MFILKLFRYIRRKLFYRKIGFNPKDYRKLVFNQNFLEKNPRSKFNLDYIKFEV